MHDDEDEFNANELALKRDEMQKSVQAAKQMQTANEVKPAVSDEESKQIEELGLKKAAYYRNKTQVEGILRLRLQAIHEIIMSRCKSGAQEALLPNDLVDERVRAALCIQGLHIDAKPSEGLCLCGETPCEGSESGCIPTSFKVTW